MSKSIYKPPYFGFLKKHFKHFLLQQHDFVNFFGGGGSGGGGGFTEDSFPLSSTKLNGTTLVILVVLVDMFDFLISIQRGSLILVDQCFQYISMF
jgi:hypothetical protein